MINNLARIKLCAEHNKLRIVKQFDSTTQTISGIELEIDFRTDDWEQMTRTIVFTRGTETPRLVVLTDNQTTCLVPWEILNTTIKGCFSVGVFGVGRDGERMPTNKVQLPIVEGCYTEGQTPAEPSADVYSQIIAALLGKENIADIEEDIAAYCTEQDFASKSYVDNAISAIPTPDVSGQITTHNMSVDAHQSLFDSKVDKIDGKGLSANDYTTEEKTKLENITESTNNDIVDMLIDIDMLYAFKDIDDSILTDNDDNILII